MFKIGELVQLKDTDEHGRNHTSYVCYGYTCKIIATNSERSRIETIHGVTKKSGTFSNSSLYSVGERFKENPCKEIAELYEPIRYSLKAPVDKIMTTLDLEPSFYQIGDKVKFNKDAISNIKRGEIINCKNMEGIVLEIYGDEKNIKGYGIAVDVNGRKVEANSLNLDLISRTYKTSCNKDFIRDIDLDYEDYIGN